MTSLIIIALIFVTVGIVILKTNLVQSFAAFFSAVFAGTGAFAFHENLAAFLISKELLVNLAPALSFLVIFGILFAIFMAIAMQLLIFPVDFGSVTEKGGMIVFGLLLGIFTCGYLLVAFGMAPLGKWPYQRFGSGADPTHPSTTLLNPDGLVTGLFNTVSSGSLNGKQSFAMVRADFLNQLYLQRQSGQAEQSDTIDIPAKQAAWPMTEIPVTDSGNTLSIQPEHTPYVVRIGFRKKLMRGEDPQIIAAQLRVVSKSELQADDPLSGSGTVIYPTAYYTDTNKVKVLRAGETIGLKKKHFGDERVKWIDIVFQIPQDHVPVLAAYGRENMFLIPKPIKATDAPEPEVLRMTAPPPADVNDANN